MSCEEQAAVNAMGWNESTWTDGDSKPFARAWVTLTTQEQQAAQLLGFSSADFTEQGHAEVKEQEPAADEVVRSVGDRSTLAAVEPVAMEEATEAADAATPATGSEAGEQADVAEAETHADVPVDLAAAKETLGENSISTEKQQEDEEEAEEEVEEAEAQADMQVDPAATKETVAENDEQEEDEVEEADAQADMQMDPSATKEAIAENDEQEEEEDEEERDDGANNEGAQSGADN